MIARRYNPRPEQKLAHQAEDARHEDQLPSARTHPEPHHLVMSLDSSQQVIGKNEKTSLIAREAAEAQNQADEIDAYLRNSSPDWRTVSYQMGYLGEHVRNLQKLVAGFERREPKLTEVQSQQLERLKYSSGQ